MLANVATFRSSPAGEITFAREGPACGHARIGIRRAARGAYLAKSGRTVRAPSVRNETRQTLDAGSPFRHSAASAVGRGAVLVVERLLSGARQRGVCKE